MITRKQGLMTWAKRWRQLRAWRRDLSDVTIKISDQAHASRLGTCWSHEQRITIYRGESFIGELSTLVHELAHAATIGDGHDEAWQETYANAVTEITGITVIPIAYSYFTLNLGARAALKSWWARSGEAAIWNLARSAP